MKRTLTTAAVAGLALAMVPLPAQAASTTVYREDVWGGYIHVACTNPGTVHLVGPLDDYTCPTSTVWVRTAKCRNTKQRGGPLGTYFTWAKATGWREDDNGGWFKSVADGSC